MFGYFENWVKLIRNFWTSGNSFVTKIKNQNLQQEIEALGNGQLVKMALLAQREQGINPEHFSLTEGEERERSGAKLEVLQVPDQHLPPRAGAPLLCRILAPGELPRWRKALFGQTGSDPRLRRVE